MSACERSEGGLATPFRKGEDLLGKKQTTVIVELEGMGEELALGVEQHEGLAGSGSCSTVSMKAADPRASGT